MRHNGEIGNTIIFKLLSFPSWVWVLLTMDSLNYQEQLRRQKILNLMENKDYLLVIASQQQKSVQQVKYELMLKLTEGK